MRIDLFHELSVPSFMGCDEREVHHQALEEIALADQAGFGGIWLVEHHFQREFSHCPAPEVLFGAITQRTARIRIGHAVVLLPFNHPVRVAERIAALDILSGGRMDVGVGRGFSPIEYEVFGCDMKDSRSRTDEGLEILKRAWADEPFSFEGRHWSFPEIDVVPKPVQKPHPKLWTAAVSPETFVMAAEEGLGVLAGPFKPLFMVAEDRERFVTRCRELGRDPRALGFGMTVGATILDDHARAREVAGRNVRWFYQQLLRLTAPVLQRGGESYRYYRDELGTLRQLTGESPGLEALETAGMVIAGDSDHAIEQLRALAKGGIDHVLLSLQAGGVPHRDVMRSIELFGERIIPAVRDLTSDEDPRMERGDMRVFLREAPDLTPALLFESMPLVFRSERANGMRALYRVDLSGEGGGTWWIDVGDGRCNVYSDRPERDADVHIESDTDTWLSIARGERSQAGALIRRRVKVRGNPRKAARFTRLFQ